MYGTPVAITFRGEEKFTTIIGGFSSIVVLGIIFVYTISQIRKIIQRDDTSINSNLIRQSLIESTESHNITKGGFRVGIAGIHTGGTSENVFYEPDYLNFTFGHYKSVKNRIGGDPITETYNEIYPRL